MVDHSKVLFEKIGLVKPDTTCVLRLNFDENQGTIAKDTSGKRNNGTLPGAPNTPTWVAGGGLDFDGDDDYVQVAHSTSLNQTTKLSVEYWIDGVDEDAPNGYWSMFDKEDSSDSGWITILVNGASTNLKKVLFRIASGGERSDVQMDAGVDVTSLCHIAITYDNGYVRIFFNTEEIKSGDVTWDSIVPNTDPIIIGMESTRYFKGILYKPRIYNRVLTPAEIKHIYEQGENYISKEISKASFTETVNLTDTVAKGPLKAVTETLTATDTIVKGTLKSVREKIGLVKADVSCVLRMDLDEGFGTIAKDTSGKGNHGTLATPTWVDGGLDFDGLDDYMITGTLSPAITKNDSFSLMMWYKPAALNNWKGLLSLRGASWNYYSLYGSHGDIPAFFNQLSDDSIADVRGDTLTIGEWVHLAVTYDVSTKTYKLFQDTVLKETDIVAFLAKEDSTTIRFAQIYPATWYEGIIDGVHIYNRALSAAEIKHLYEQGENYIAKGITKAPFTETATLTDTVQKGPLKDLNETLTLTDTIIKDTLKALTETINLTDTIIKDILKALTETINLTDAVEKGITKEPFTENLTISDTLTRKWVMFRTYTEILTLLDDVHHAWHDYVVAMEIYLTLLRNKIYLKTRSDR